MYFPVKSFCSPTEGSGVVSRHAGGIRALTDSLFLSASSFHFGRGTTSSTDPMILGFFLISLILDG